MYKHNLKSNKHIQKFNACITVDVYTYLHVIIIKKFITCSNVK